MNAWLHNGRVVFLPLKGATPINVVEETNGPVGEGQEPGAIESVELTADGKAKVRRTMRAESKRTKAKKDLAAANNVAQLKKALLDLLE